jgi:hypothetical protein
MSAPRIALSVLGLALVLAGCRSGEPTEPRERKVRFAVVAAPEVGQDDGDLLTVVTRLSREKDLAFVLVLGPLLAKDADATSLDLLKNDLGQIAAPVYVAFSATSAVSSGIPCVPSKLTDEEFLSAVEGLGPGAAHKASYTARPDRAKGVVLNALAPNGSGAAESLPEDAEYLLWFGSRLDERKPSSTEVVPDLIVSTSPSGAVVLEGIRPGESKVANEPVRILVPTLAFGRAFAVVTLSPASVEVGPIPIDRAAGKTLPAPEPAALPDLDRRKPR